MPETILVGLDGSEESEQALDWAVEEAALRHAALKLVSAVHTPYGVLGRDGQAFGTWSADMKRHAEVVLAGGVARAGLMAPDMEVTSTLVFDEPAHALLRLSADCAAAVLGARHRSRISRLFLGSVSASVSMHAHVPVIVARQSPAEGPVVVGVDGSPLSSEALDFAILEALGRGCPLLVVHAWDTYHLGASGLPRVSPSARSVEEGDVLRTLEHDLDPWRSKHPGLQIDALAPMGHPASELLELSKRCRLLVVGAHSERAVGRVLLGGVAATVLARADCPVAVVRNSRS